MATAEVYIKDALREINVISEVDPLPPEMGAHGLRRLNQMMALWKIRDIDVGYFALAATTDEVVIPDWAELGVITSLSVLLAPKYGKSVSVELIGVAMGSIEGLDTKTLIEAKSGVDLSYLPKGAGHRGPANSILTDD